MENDAINRSAVYISLSDALDTIYNFDTSDCADVDDVVGRIYEAVGAIPDADVVPVVHAHWIHCKGKTQLWHCSACGRTMIYNPKKRTYNIEKKPMSKLNKFCRNCGARMDERVEKGE